VESESNVSDSDYQPSSYDNDRSLPGNRILDDDDDLNTYSESRDDCIDGTSSPCVWFMISGNFQPRTTISKDRFQEFCDHKNTSHPLDMFVKMFPYSLFMQISYYTNGMLTRDDLHLPCKTSEIL